MMQQAIDKMNLVKDLLHEQKPLGWEGAVDTLNEAAVIVERGAPSDQSAKITELVEAVETRGKKVQELTEKLQSASEEIEALKAQLPPPADPKPVETLTDAPKTETATDAAPVETASGDASGSDGDQR